MDVVTVGGATIDAFLQIEHGNDVVRFDHEHGDLLIKAGEKIEVDTCTFSLGGNACNVAVGLSRLGFSSGVCAEIGTDEFAQKIIHGLEYDRVKTDYLIQTSNTASSFAIALNIESERTLFVEHGNREHNFDLSTLAAKWMYLTSVGDKWEHVYRYMQDVVKEKNIQLVYSPGTLQLEKYTEEVKALFPLTKVLCVNKSEARRIVKFYLEKEETDVPTLLRLLHELGPEIISLTDGSVGGFALDSDGNIWDIDRFPQEVVERTGAGDAYATGFMAAIMEGNSVSDAMRYGTMNAASVIGTIGAEKGLLTKEEMHKKLAENPDFQPKKL
jgi:ribokinase